QRTTVEDDLVRLTPPAGAHHRVATVGKEARRRLGREGRLESVEAPTSFGAKQPQNVGARTSGRPGVVGAFQGGGRNRENSARIPRQSRLERQEPTTVGVPDLRQ